ncbi:MAG TPA: hypothetical protein VFG68_21595 [Fimbriiglobus sp.]|nr:hypothetical protein [Fimbriiglobus sp.]
MRRGVAARELGLRHILARLIEDGNLIARLVIPLDSLYSRKDWVSRSDYRYQRLVALLATPAGRARMPEIEVERLPSGRVRLFTRLLDVRLEA